MARVKKSCLTLTNWTFGSLTSDINTCFNQYLTHCPMNIGDLLEMQVYASLDLQIYA